MNSTLTITPRQEEVVRLLALGMTSAEIAKELDLATSTARLHVDALRQRLGCEFRRQIPLAYMEQTGVDPFPRPVAA